MTSMRLPRPAASDVETKSPNPSMAATAASSNGEQKKALARWAGWCSTLWSRRERRRRDAERVGERPLDLADGPLVA